MAYENKLPSVRVALKVEEYNKLISLLTDVEDVDIEDIKNRAEDIKDKILHYTQPVEEDKVVTRFYPSQVEIVLLILLSKSKEIEVNSEYYKILIENREKYKKQLEKNEA
ncbi:MAG: hypothetical protein J6D03_07690 [Clostridia bacterium]|nr:hypothetical protein [Clostridia bacterium]MBO5530553.1 hypothetical protein [Bacilli bacterium]